jgi:hypothetical protein
LGQTVCVRRDRLPKLEQPHFHARPDVVTGQHHSVSVIAAALKPKEVPTRLQVHPQP